MKPSSDLRTWSRRDVLKAVAAAGFVASLPGPLSAQLTRQKTSVERYLQSLARLDGGYAWHTDGRAHLTSTYAVVGSYRAIDETPPRGEHLAEFIRTHHPARLKKLEQEHREFEYQQIQSLVWLGEDVTAFKEQVRSWTGALAYLKQYERHGWPVFSHEMAAILCRALVGLPPSVAEREYLPYLQSRRRPDGSFNSSPTENGGGGHVMNTWWGLQTLRVLGRLQEKREETIAWLRACQLPDGAFTWQPGPDLAGVGSCCYAWAAVQALALLGAAPNDRVGCIDFVHSLRNGDGGFGDRPGWLSNPIATYYALDSLRILGAIDSAGPRAPTTAKPSGSSIELDENLKVFSVQIEAHGQGSPADAVHLAKSLRIHLWGAKNASGEWLRTAQAIADRQGAPVTFFAANEEYGTWVNHPGFGTYSHTSDVIAPPGEDFGASLAGNAPSTWPEFRERRLLPLHKAGGRLVWQFGENEALVQVLLDDSLARGGYSAISTFHFGNPDFTNSEPFLQRFRGQIPFVALQDAHGDEPWWFADMTEGFRTVFIGKEPTWSAWVEALKRNWVAAVRHDSVSSRETWMHSGSPEVARFLRQKEVEWRWWDNADIRRPLVSIVAVRPEDKFEAGRPERGVNLRVRCAWTNTTQGRPRQPIVELTTLELDGRPLAPKLVTPLSRANGPPLDQYHVASLSESLTGEHAVTAFLRVIATGATSSHGIQVHL